MIEEMGWVFREKVIGGWIRKGIVSLLRAFWEGNLWGGGGYRRFCDNWGVGWKGSYWGKGVFFGSKNEFF